MSFTSDMICTVDVWRGDELSCSNVGGKLHIDVATQWNFLEKHRCTAMAISRGWGDEP